ncbi:MAG TPA: hypothetical protein VK957_04455 [Lunatimonas sp.]|nr:hypothetical protein [Lunatimonas sp.]
MDHRIYKYEKLFSIRFTHPAFPNSAENGGLLTNFLTIEPDRLTRQLFKNQEILFRTRQDMLLCIIRINEVMDSPYFSLPDIIQARFLFNVKDRLLVQTNIPDSHGGENLYRFRINLRSSADSMDLSGADLGEVEDREPRRIFRPGNPGTWETIPVNISGYFGIIDIVTEGSSTHRLYTNVTDQLLFFTTANGNEHEHLFTIQLNN